MDQHLISLARAVKRRQRARHATLWLFTDAQRQPNLLAVIASLPRGICGVVFRHDDAPDRAALAQRVARMCRERRISLVVAGDWRLAAALGAGLHLRGGLRPRCQYRGGVTTASAHDRAGIRAAARAGAGLVFISPAFSTASHPGTPALGAVRWSALAQHGGKGIRRAAMLALGGVTGTNGLRLSQVCAGFGAIDALSLC
jgi:thiamine-phosphate pyrophosphorylase